MHNILKTFKQDALTTKLDKIIEILILLDMVLIGSDRIAIRVHGMTIRFVQFLLLATFILLWHKKKYRIVDLAIFAPFFIANVISTVFSFAFFTSATYIVWTVFNYLMVYCLFFSWAKGRGKDYVVDMLLLSFVIQSIYVIVQYIMGINDYNDIFFPMQVYMGIFRPAIWFYEPSYLATYYSIYFVLSFYLYLNMGNSKYRYHMWFSLFCLLLISSTTGYMGIAVTIGLSLLLSLSKLNKLKIRRTGVALMSVMIISSSTYFLDPHMFNIFAGRIFQSGAPQTASNDKNQVINKIAGTGVGTSSGGRVQGWKESIEVFMEHPVLGIGPNAYPQYTGKGVPPTNVTLEVFANLGVVGVITFTIFLLGILYRAFKETDKEDYIGKGLLLAFVIFMILLQTNQNYLRLYLWLQLGLISGCCRFSKDKKILT